MVRILALVLVSARPVCGWEALLPWDPWDDGNIHTRALLFDPAGNVVVASTLDRDDATRLAVASVARRTGAIRWSYKYAPGESWLWEVAIDGRGDVLLAGSTDGAAAPSISHVAVIKLDGRTGTMRWLPDLGLGSALAVATDEQDDIFVYASRMGRRSLIKLSGVDGRVLWETLGDLGPGWYRSIAVDHASNVVLHDSHRVSKFDGRTGVEVWSHLASESGAGSIAIAVLPGDDLITQDCLWNSVANAYVTHIVRRDGNDGTERWRRRYLEGPRSYCYTQVRIGPRSDVFIAGRPGADSEVRLMAARLDASTGAERWRWDGPHVPNPLLPIDLAVGVRNELVLLANRTATTLSARTGRRKSRMTVDGLWPGGRVAVGKDGAIVVAGHGDEDDLGSGMLVVRVARPGSSRLRREGRS